MSPEEWTGLLPLERTTGPKKPWRLSNQLLHQVLSVCLIGSTAIPATAQKTTFQPSFSLDLFATNNVDYVGDEDRSDRGAGLGLRLPVERTLERGSIAFLYHPVIVAHDEFTELDNIRHLASLAVSTRPSRSSSLSIRAGYLRSQRQGDPRSVDPADLFLDRRTDRQRASVDLSYQGRLGRHWDWSLAVGGADWKYEEISGFEEDSPSVPVEDRSEFRSAVNVARILSHASSIGVSYGYRMFDLELSGEETSQSISLVYTREIENRLSLRASMGGFFNSEEAGSGSAGSLGDGQSGVQVAVSIIRTFRQSSLTFLVGHVPTAGGARIGTSINGYIGVSYTSSGLRDWTWGLYSRLARRDPSDPQLEIIDSFSAGIQVGRHLGRQLAIRLGGNYVYQSGDEVAANDSYLRGQLGLVWFPLGRSGGMGGVSY